MRLKDQSAQKFRRQTIVSLKGQLSQAKIGAHLQVTQGYVSYVHRRYSTQGDLAYEVSTGKGAKPKLEKEQVLQLDEALKKGSQAHGFEAQIWTTKMVTGLIKELFGVVYSTRQVQRILKNMGFTLQKPQKIDHRQSPQAVEAWKNEGLPALKKSR